MNSIENGGEHLCRKCSKKVLPEEVVFHGIREGYSAAYFPLFHFEKVPLCPACLTRQRKTDFFEKGLAVVALAIVGYFMIIGFVALFGSSGL